MTNRYLYHRVAFADCFCTLFEVVRWEWLLGVFWVELSVRLVDGVEHVEQHLEEDCCYCDQQAIIEEGDPFNYSERTWDAVDNCWVFYRQEVYRRQVHCYSDAGIQQAQEGFREQGGPIIPGACEGIIVSILEAFLHRVVEVPVQIAGMDACVTERDDYVNPGEEHPQCSAEDTLEVAEHFPNGKELLDCHAYLQRKGIEKITGMMKPNAKAAVTSPKLLLPDIQTQSIRTKATPHNSPPDIDANTRGFQGYWSN